MKTIARCVRRSGVRHMHHSEDILGRAVYLDAQATQPVDPRVLDSMMPFMLGSYGNPHSRTHEYGWDAEHAVEQARENVCTIFVNSFNTLR